jgi:predicted Zn-dependent peptidase
MLAVKLFEHVGHPAHTQGQFASELAKALSELEERLVDEAELKGAELFRGKELRLVDVKA